MPQSRHPLIEARRDQMFPVLEPPEVGRLWRFGELKSYAAGDRIATTGEIAPGAFVILAYLAAHNASPKPFVWTQSAETIMAKLERCPVPTV